jgi:hypothetical protein
MIPSDNQTTLPPHLSNSAAYVSAQLRKKRPSLFHDYKEMLILATGQRLERLSDCNSILVLWVPAREV